MSVLPSLVMIMVMTGAVLTLLAFTSASPDTLVMEGMEGEIGYKLDLLHVHSYR